LQPEAGTDEDKSSFWDQLLAETIQLPGVRGVAYASRGLLRGTGLKGSVGLPGERVPKSEFLNTSLNSVSPEYFDTMGMRIIAGRGFVRTDVNRSEVKPSIVNQTFVRRFSRLLIRSASSSAMEAYLTSSSQIARSLAWSATRSIEVYGSRSRPFSTTYKSVEAFSTCGPRAIRQR
jgi:hypothetical protein